jgi:hypothetical protein
MSFDSSRGEHSGLRSSYWTIFDQQQVSNNENIPKLIHMTWKSTTINTPQAKHIQSWIRVNKGWKVRFWTDADNRELIERDFSWFLPIFDSYKENIKRADAVRYFILYSYGGLYVDLDFLALKPIDKFLSRYNGSLFLGEEPREHSRILYNMTRLVCNALMLSRPKHPFWLHVFDYMSKNPNLNVMEATGPKMLEKSLRSWERADNTIGQRFPVTVVEPAVFYPTYDEALQRDTMVKRCKKSKVTALTKSICKDLKKRFFRKGRITSRTFARHDWSHTWIYKSRSERGRRKFNASEFIRSAEEGNFYWKSLYSPDLSPRPGARRYMYRRRGGRVRRIPLKPNPRFVAISSRCKKDLKQFCNDVLPGKGRTRKCLVLNAKNVSNTCCQWLNKDIRRLIKFNAKHRNHSFHHFYNETTITNHVMEHIDCKQKH